MKFFGVKLVWELRWHKHIVENTFSTKSLYILPISPKLVIFNTILELKLMFLSKFSPKYSWQKIGAADMVPGISYAFCKIFTSESDSRIANVRLSVRPSVSLSQKLLSLSESSLSAIMPIYWSLRYLSAIMPISYHANQPPCPPSTIRPISDYSCQP